MPRSGPRRPPTAIRLGLEVQDKVDDRAHDEGLIKGNGDPNRSELIRRFIDYGLENMPKGFGEEPAKGDQKLVKAHEKTTRLADAVELANSL